jgi:hypothetical protein
LRLSPPAWGQPHEAIQADEVLGRAIPAKAIVFGLQGRCRPWE